MACRLVAYFQNVPVPTLLAKPYSTWNSTSAIRCLNRIVCCGPVVPGCALRGTGELHKARYFRLRLSPFAPT